MSTLPGLASKGEKGKSKYQSLDINSLYRVSRGESLEKQQQKSTLPFKHGMQSLGRVPSARRPPANLPSIKSEHSGTDAAVSLVPSGGPGWGKQDSTTPLATTSPQTVPTTTTNSNVSSPSATNTTLTPHQAAIALPVTTTIPPPAKHNTSAVPVTTDKSWSSVMSNSDLVHPPPYQSPQFQHEFPSLSAGDGGQQRPGTDTQYGPGPSLRPQTEGSWMQGGSRANVDGPPRSSSVPLGAPPQLSAQVGLPHQPLPPQYHGILPGFMFRDNVTPNGHGTQNMTNMPQPVMNANRARDGRQPARSTESEEMARRPIIKEEDLNRMDDMTKDMGWAAQDEIDYYQKLAFSDEESAPDKNFRKKSAGEKELEKTERHQESDVKCWTRAVSNRSRSADEDEILAQKRRQQQQVIVHAAERAKQRKEEEERKCLEAKLKSKREKEQEESQGTINPLIIPPQQITPAPIPVPEWEKDKERPRDDENKSNKGDNSDFRQLTSIEGRNFIRKDSRSNERSGQGYPRQMQNLPPRLQKKQQFRNNTSPQPSYGQYDSRWNQMNKTSPGSQNRRNEWDGSDKEKDDDKHKFSNEDIRRGHSRPYSDSNRKSSESRYSDDSRDSRSQDYDYRKEKEDGKWEKQKYNEKEKEETKFDSISRQSSDEWHSERLEKYEKLQDSRYERPQRPDSRDSRTSKDSRHSRDSGREVEPKEHLGPWTESVTYEERKREREDRRVVPGPITKEKIEADEKQNEKRNLTQLKKGSISEKKHDLIEEKDHRENVWSQNESCGVKGSWADDVMVPLDALLQEEKPKLEVKKDDMRKSDSEIKEKDDARSLSAMNRNRQSGRSQQGWDNRPGMGGYSYYKKSRGSRSGRPISSKMGEFHATDSEESVDDISVSNESGKEKSPKPTRKIEKDEKNRDFKSDKPIGKPEKYENKKDTYEPRGEPSRHGRGGGNMRGRGGLSKRIDGYGPPPSKSPFSHSDEKDKKIDEVVESVPFDDKSQQPSTAGVIGSARKEFTQPLSNQLRIEKKHDDKYDRNKSRRLDIKKGKPKSRDENDTSEHSDDSLKRKTNELRNRPGNQHLRRNPPPRLANEKRSFNQQRHDFPPRQNSNGSLRQQTIKKDEKPEPNSLCNAIADISLMKDQDDQVEEQMDDKLGAQDSDGFQEVKSKKNVKERQKIDEKPTKPLQKPENKIDRKPKPTYQLSQQQIANIPSLMDTPVNPPAVIPQPSNKNQYDRSRQKLPPRFAKQRENSRLQKVQMQQHGICDINELNKVNQSMNLYGLKDGPTNMPMVNAWDKPLSTQLRTNIEQEMVLSVGIENCKSIDQPHSPAQNSSPGNDKMIGKDKSVLDGSTPPVNTIIFENTNFKSVPGVRNRNDNKSRTKMDDNSPGMDSSVMTGFTKPISDLLNKNEDIQMKMAFNKEDSADMKLDFFDSDMSHLTDDKGSKNISLPRSMHAITSSNSTISPSTADLNFKIASVKKVWDNTMPTVIEHGINQEDSSSFATSFGPDPNSLDPSSAFGKGADNVEDVHDGYSPSPNQNTSNNTTNVCKVKPTQQVAGTTGQGMVGHQPHSGIMTSGLPPLSPPPIQPVIGPNVGLNQPPQQYTANQHIGYQASLGGSTQFGMPAIPSPPNVLYNSTQPLQPNLYGGFPIERLSGQGTSQFSQYPYNIGQNASSHYSAQSLYLQTQPHPPPTAQAPPDIYQSLTNYRIPPNSAPFGQNQQLNNPTTVLISSTSNSLMSASVKPSNQPISAIGTKTGAVGQTYQQSQQGQQLYMAYDPAIQPNYLANTGVMQRGPSGPVQNNVVQALQPSSSYYSGSTGGQTGYFQQPGSSTLQSTPLQQHQANYGLQGNVFGTHNQSHSSPNLQNIGSHYLSQLQFAAAMNAQQFRSQSMQNSSYLKSMAGQQVNDQGGRSQQLKSPGSQQEVLSSVFNSVGPQIPSPKSRQNCKQPPPQPSPTTQHKYNLYPGVGNQQSNQTQRYPTPIQRPPMNFQPNLNSVQNNGPNQKHRTNNTKGPSRQYYSQGSLSSQNEKPDENKLGDHGAPNNPNNTTTAGGGSINVSKTNIGNVNSAAVSKSEITKDKEESSAIKD